MYKNLDDLMYRLSCSKFRSKFHLKECDIKYIGDKGLGVIRKHAMDFISKRLAPSFIENDGKQTPMRGHPVFIAEHATGTCCRNCLYKWHKIEKGKELTEEERKYVVDVIMKWIENEIKENK